jgi:hypothetical protein
MAAICCRSATRSAFWRNSSRSDTRGSWPH